MGKCAANSKLGVSRLRSWDPKDSSFSWLQKLRDMGNEPWSVAIMFPCSIKSEWLKKRVRTVRLCSADGYHDILLFSRSYKSTLCPHYLFILPMTTCNSERKAAVECWWRLRSWIPQPSSDPKPVEVPVRLCSARERHGKTILKEREKKDKKWVPCCLIGEWSYQATRCD